MDKSREVTEIIDYYNAGAEQGRLQRGIGRIELERTQKIISRYLSNEKQVIYDIGGGTGTYSRWLAQLKHEVHMFELSPKAVEHAMGLQNHCDRPIHRIEEADARKIERPDETADMVLLMGPLYHLTSREERLKALVEAARLLKTDGVMIISAISRFGSTLWGLSVFGKDNNYVTEHDFAKMIERELHDGQHIRPQRYPNLIARSYFHTPSELSLEIEQAGLEHEQTVPVEGPIWIVPTLEEKWTDSQSRDTLMKIIEMVEKEESLIGMSPHFIAVARKLRANVQG